MYFSFFKSVIRNFIKGSEQEKYFDFTKVKGWNRYHLIAPLNNGRWEGGLENFFLKTIEAEETYFSYKFIFPFALNRISSNSLKVK